MRELKGLTVANDMTEKTLQRVQELEARGITPMLATVRVGANPGDIAYENGLLERAEKNGIDSEQIVLPENITQEDLLAEIDKLNQDPGVDGVLIFRPLPKQIDEEAVCRALDPKKDVDGITPGSMAGVFMGSEKGFPPCTAAACIQMLDYYGIDLNGKNVTVFGRSLVVGKPVAMMAMDRNATVTICHSRTTPEMLQDAGRKADVVIAAVGRANFLTRDLTSEDQIILDVGINDDGAGGICGDVDQEAASAAAAVTPVPGGVGSVTTAILMDHVVTAAARSALQKK